MTTGDYMLGIDVGQANDPTALALLEHDRSRERVYRLRALYRFPLGTPYTQLTHPISKRLAEPPLSGRTRLAIDATGVGAPVIDLFRQQLPRVPLYAITITGGNALTGSCQNPHVPKRDLISTTIVILEQRRLRIALSLPETDTLINELHDYRRTTSDTGHESYSAAAGSHDDLVLALSLALWTAEHKPLPQPYRRISVPQGRLPTIDEMIRIRNHSRGYL